VVISDDSERGQVGLQLAIRHPTAVRRLIAASASFRRVGMIDGFWVGLLRLARGVLTPAKAAATICRPPAGCARPSNPTGSTTSSPASPQVRVVDSYQQRRCVLHRLLRNTAVGDCPLLVE
jgi:pimeloyl-ACP methyl ester carboxylesterase